jgi:putative membrane protein
MMNWGDGGYGWGMGFSPIFMIIFVVLIILGAIYIVKVIASSPRSRGSEETALDILKKRLAKGEITKEEFQELKKHIE